MNREENEKACVRLRLALDMAATAEAMFRAKLAREMPGANAAEIERLICAWFGQRPGAENGDASGTPSTWPPSR